MADQTGRPTAPHMVSTLVGRERELAALRDALVGALAGSGSLVLIGGEAGIGKTALAARLAREAMDVGVRTLVGHCYDLSETPPYGPWLECFEARHEAAPTSPAPPLLAVAPNHEAFFAQAIAFFAALAAERPLVVTLEDLHWADAASLDLLRALARTLAALPLLLVVTYRCHGYIFVRGRYAACWAACTIRISVPRRTDGCVFSQYRREARLPVAHRLLREGAGEACRVAATAPRAARSPSALAPD